MIEELRLAFAAIQSLPAPHPGDLSIAPLGTAGHWVGVDDQRRLHLLFRRGDHGTELPASLDAIRISSRPLTIGGLQYSTIDVTSMSPALSEVFEQFAAAVLERLLVDRAASPAAVLGSVLAAWRRFLHHTPGSGPGRNQLAAIFGELLVVLELTRLRPEAGIAAWAGPDRARHDFRVGSRAVEVKTTLGGGYVVTVHGLSQLAEPDSGTLFVHLVRLEAVAGTGQSVADLVDEVLGAGAPAEGLYDALASAGLPPDQIRGTQSVTFEIRSRSTLPVDDGFPRITPRSFVAGEPPPGVTGLVYQTDLSHQLHRAISDDAWAELMANLASGLGL